MINTRAELENELSQRLQLASNSSFIDSDRKTALIQDAYSWATNMFIWLDLVKAMTTNTIANKEYYDYPDSFRSMTIMRLEIGGEEYKRVNFYDYLKYKKDNTTSTKKLFSNFGRQFFVHPTPTTNGSANMDVWGAVQADDLDEDTSETIFSNNKIVGNEAIVKKAFSVAIIRDDANLSQKEETDALGMLAKINNDEWKDVQMDHRINHPKFDVPDYFAEGNSSVTPLGRFNYDPSL